MNKAGSLEFTILPSHRLYDSLEKMKPKVKSFKTIEGISQLLDTVMFIKQEINPDVIIEGIVLTMLDARTSYARGMVSLISNMVLAIMSEQKKPETERVMLQSRQIS